jgi:hypothetical protein
VNNFKRKMRSAKNFVARHKEAFVVGAVAITVISLQQSALRSATGFIEEHGLIEEFIDAK